MAKCIAVPLSKLGPCWSAKRHMGLCAECKQVEKCKLSEAHEGRLNLRRYAVQDALIKLDGARLALELEQQHKHNEEMIRCRKRTGRKSRR